MTIHECNLFAVWGLTLIKSNAYAMVRIYGFPVIFQLYLAIVPFQLRLQYANVNVYKKQHILRFSRENRAVVVLDTIYVATRGAIEVEYILSSR